MSLIIPTPSNLVVKAEDVSYYAQVFLVRWSVSESAIKDLPFPVEARFIILASDLTKAVTYEMERLMQGQGGRFKVNLEAYELDAADVAVCLSEGSDVVDIRTEAEQQQAADGANSVAE